MSAAERCDFTDLLKAQCGHCRPSRLPGFNVPHPANRPASSRYGPWFTASFDSDCDGPCGGQIDEGEHARSDGEGGWLCELCGGYES